MRAHWRSSCSPLPAARVSRPNTRHFPGLDSSLNDLKHRVRFRARAPAPPGAQPRVARAKFAQQMLPFISKLSLGCSEYDPCAHRPNLASIE